MHFGDRGVAYDIYRSFLPFSFLPVSLAVYYLSKEDIREYVLLAISLVFYACGSFVHLGLFCGAAAVNILFGWLLSGCRESRQLKKLLLVAGVVFDVLLLAFYKYIHTEPGLPLGISFFTFKAISYLADIYAGRTGNDPARAALYLSFSRRCSPDRCRGMTICGGKETCFQKAPVSLSVAL